MRSCCGVTFVLAGLMFAVAALTADAAIDAAALRAATPLPRLSFSFGYQVVNGMIISNNAQDQSAQINTLKNALTGSADDAERWRRMGLIDYEAKDAAASQQAYRRAAALYEAQARQRPGNEALLVRLGLALNDADRLKQAEIVLRHAVRLSPQDTNAWSALGVTVSSKIFPALLTPAQQTEVSFQQPAALNTRFKGYKPSPSQMKQAGHLLEEAGRCFDKGVSVPQPSALSDVRRAEFRAYSRPSIILVLDALTQERLTLAAAVEKVSPLVAHNFFTNPGALADMRQSVKRAPSDLPTVAAAAAFEAASQLNGSWNAVPAKRQAVMQDMTLLGRIAQGKDAVTAAEAADTAAAIWVLAGQKQEAEREYRLAVARDPHNQSAWDGLTSLLVSDERYKDTAALAAQRLKALDNVHTRLLLAKIDDKLNLPAEVQSQVQAALKDDPNDLTANLAQVALLLRGSGDPAVMGQARQHLDECGSIYQKNQTPENWSNYMVVIGVYDALIGSDTDARKVIAQVLEYDPDNKEAAQVSAALGPSDTQKQIL